MKKRSVRPAGGAYSAPPHSTLGSRHNIDRITVSEVQVLTSTVRVVSSARDLGVVIDSRLTMADYIRHVCLSLSLLSTATDQTHSTVADARRRLDYCNSLLYTE